MATIPQSNGYVRLQAPDDHLLRAFVARPTGTPRGALVLLQIMDQRHPEAPGARPRPAQTHPEGPGVNAFARQMAQRFADEGFAVVAPSTFSRGRVAVDYGYRYDNDPWSPRLMLPLQPMDTRAVLRDVEAAFLYARHVAPHAPVGMVGYCWGGLLAWQAASRLRGLRAAVCHYGGGMETPEERARQPLCPVLTHWPKDGRWMSAPDVQAFIAQRSDAAAAPRVLCERYDAHYGFMQPARREYDEEQARRAHERTVAFLVEHLAPPAA